MVDQVRARLALAQALCWRLFAVVWQPLPDTIVQNVARNDPVIVFLGFLFALLDLRLRVSFDGFHESHSLQTLLARRQTSPQRIVPEMLLVLINYFLDPAVVLVDALQRIVSARRRLLSLFWNFSLFGSLPWLLGLPGLPSHEEVLGDRRLSHEQLRVFHLAVLQL